jgi:nitrile hydratase accessory protein
VCKEQLLSRELGRGAEQTIPAIRAAETLTEEGGELQFETPWPGRAFSLVATMYRQGVFEWDEFQSQLIKEVQDDTYERADESLETVYYRQWMAAFQKLLVEKGVFTPEEIERRTAEFRSGERDASEFVAESVDQ